MTVKGNRGLTADLVRGWQERIGAFDPLGPNPTRHIYRAGQSGTVTYIPALEITPIGDPDEFEEMIYWRPLSRILVFALLTTPRTTARTEVTNREYPSKYVMVGTQTLPGSGAFRQDGEIYPYEDFRGLMAVSNDEIFSHTALDIADLVGIWIPRELLGPEFDTAPMAPIVSETPLARAAAQFVRTFAYDVAVRGAAVDLKAELALVDLVRSTLLDRTEESYADTDKPQQVVNAAREIIDHHYRDPAFSTEALAHILHVSRRHLYRFFSEIDESPSGLIAARRLERAREILDRSDGVGLASVAASAGFTSVATLRSRFRSAYGVSPDEYRRERQSSGNDDAADGPNSSEG